VNFFIFSSRVVNGSFGNAVGLFVYDKMRPLVEATINLVVSVILTRKLGVVGIFIGTAVSSLLTVWWREPYLLHRKIFEKELKGYFVTYGLWTMLTIMMAYMGSCLFDYLPNNIVFLVVRFLICGVGINIIYIVLFHKNDDFVYYLNIVKQFVVNKLK
jgi:hypothetical protein